MPVSIQESLCMGQQHTDKRDWCHRQSYQWCSEITVGDRWDMVLPWPPAIWPLSAPSSLHHILQRLSKYCVNCKRDDWDGSSPRLHVSLLPSHPPPHKRLNQPKESHIVLLMLPFILKQKVKFRNPTVSCFSSHPPGLNMTYNECHKYGLAKKHL